MEMEKMCLKSGYQIKGSLDFRVCSRSFSIRQPNYSLLSLISSLMGHLNFKNSKIIYNPDLAIGTGGYASAPLLKIASRYLRNSLC